MSIKMASDLSSSIAFLERSNSLKSRIENLASELSTGTTSDPNTRLSGNFSLLIDIDSRSRKLNGFNTASTETETKFSALQNSLSSIQDIVTSLSNSFLEGSAGQTETNKSLTVDQTREHLSTIIGNLNASVAGQFIFSGTKIGTQPLSDVNSFLLEFGSSLSGLTDPIDIRAAADAWFEPGGGFEASSYFGSAHHLLPIQIDEFREVSLDIKADAQIFRDTLKEIALIALAADTDLAMPLAAVEIIQTNASERLMSISDSLTQLRSHFGFQESIIEDTQAKLASGISTLQQTRSNLLSVDPYTTATHLEDAQYKLELLFSILARSSSLRLVNFL